MPKVFIFNEDLEKLASYDSANIRSVYETSSGQIRMNINKHESPNIIRGTQTYLLRDVPNSIQPYVKETKYLAWPNPSVSVVNLPYSIEPKETARMSIFDSSGKLIKTFAFGGHYNSIELNVSSFTPGVYIYRYKAQSGKFIVE